MRRWGASWELFKAYRDNCIILKATVAKFNMYRCAQVASATQLVMQAGGVREPTADTASACTPW